ncbi:phospholipase D-like domain-containing protein [Natrialba asiatica]|uniref:Phospholipase-like protein n=1 Tax=Natrialba asiatica (strain ATCC 700177 / DSM 12278 / JCM 9576 / FERM P-10747 / NBRC 102637 / 172P1) TaxID=29540 RepID=M0AMY6_NATA1|nr:phospholipase D-like domain-containing protein [Natrialba asiatica]ELY99894.1 phospholipase-like protein [Natrialba asiatica DSM 12278]
MSTRRSVALVLLVSCSLLTGLSAGAWGVSDGAPAATHSAGVTASDDLACPVAASTSSAPSTAAGQTVTRPRLVELAPNPTTQGNAGEFVVLETPPNTGVGNWTLTDGHTTAALPNETVSGRVALTANSSAAESLTDDPVLELEGIVRFAVDGDELELRNGSTVLDSVAYDRAPPAQRWYRTESEGAGVDTGTETGPDADSGTNTDTLGAGTATNTADADVTGQWWPYEATCLPVSRSDGGTATTFVLPDDPAVPLDTIREADDRLLLAGYTITSESVAAELVAAADRGVDVAVLLEASPVGGTPAATEPVLGTLTENGIDVRATGGEGARYRFHHPKYAVADDTVLVTTENWAPSGVGGESSRGWGVRLADETLATELATVFEADFSGWDTESGAEYAVQTSFVEEDDEFTASPSSSSSPSYPTAHEAERRSVESAELLIAPDNAERRVQTLLAEADEEILITQASIDGDLSLLETTVDAARRGVSVRILLDSTWYNEEDNEALATELGKLAEREDLPIEVRLVADTDRFEKIHAKGIVIDRETAVIGSANWNANSFENNREVLLAVHGSDAASYYATVFEADWSGDTWSLPIGTVLIGTVALVLAALIGRRYIRFGDDAAAVSGTRTDE